jgi:hypothetical protein
VTRARSGGVRWARFNLLPNPGAADAPRRLSKLTAVDVEDRSDQFCGPRRTSTQGRMLRERNHGNATKLHGSFRLKRKPYPHLPYSRSS